LYWCSCKNATILRQIFVRSTAFSNKPISKVKNKSIMEKRTVTVEMSTKNYAAYLELLPGCVAINVAYELMYKFDGKTVEK